VGGSRRPPNQLSSFPIGLGSGYTQVNQAPPPNALTDLRLTVVGLASAAPSSSPPLARPSTQRKRRVRRKRRLSLGSGGPRCRSRAGSRVS
jgi:hypothetical protein